MKRSGAMWAVPIQQTVVALALLAASQARAAEPVTPKRIDFNYQIRPILSDKCFNCHGPDAGKRKAGLRLDTKEGAFAKLKSDGHAIVPEISRKANSSPGYSPRMRPTGCRRNRWAERSRPAEINLLKQWVEQGAEWKDHWAFIPPGDVPLPEVKHTSWPRNAIDRFVLARLEARGALALTRGEQGAVDPPGDLRPYGAPPDTLRDRRLPGRSSRRMPTSGSSTGCSPRLGLASG